MKETNTMSNFLNTTGEAIKNNINYAKLGFGTTQIRLVGDLLPGYCYWLTNAAGKKMKAPNLAFNPDTETWIPGAADPVRELGFTEKNEKGETVPMKSKRDYNINIINRASGKAEVLALSKTMFDAIVAYCRDTGTTDPTKLELFIDKTGNAAQWTSIRYNLNVVKTMTTNADQEKVAEFQKDDEAIIADIKPIREIFKRPTVEELRASIAAFLGATEQKSDTQGAPADSSAQEALNDLD